MGDEPVTKQDLASFKDFVVSQLALHKSVISSEVQKSQEVASAALSASNSLRNSRRSSLITPAKNVISNLTVKC